MSGERRKVRVGTVIQDRMDKTVVVAVEWRRPHKLYRKPVRRRSRFYAHDEANQCRIGDEVRIIETRPLSRLKRWRVVEVISSTDIAEIAPQEIDREIIEGADAPQTASEEPVEAAAPAAVVGQVDAAPEEAASAPDAPAAEAPAEDDGAAPAPHAPEAEADAEVDEDAPAPDAPEAEAPTEDDEAASAPDAPAAEAPTEDTASEADREATDDGEAEEKKETSE